MTKRLLITLGIIFYSNVLYAAGTVGPVVISNNSGTSRYTSYTIPWTSDASGNANGTTFSLLAWGRVVQVEFTPGAGGVQPTTLYDITLNDTRSIDYIGGAGANLSNTVSTVLTTTNPTIVGGITLELSVTNAGNAKQGTVVIWVEQ